MGKFKLMYLKFSFTIRIDIAVIYDLAEEALDIIIPLFKEAEELRNHQLLLKYPKDSGQKITYKHTLKEFNVFF